MAEKKIAVVEDFLTCPVCLETFKEPVSLGCNHSFCSSCLRKHWEKNTRDCPLCRRRSSKDLNVLLVNFALKELCISFSEREKSDVPTGEVDVVCFRHLQSPVLFCLDEGCALCALCEHSLPEHRDHEVVPVETAVSDLKRQLRSQLKSLRKQRDQYEAVEETYADILQHSEKQAESCEHRVRAVFDQLHQFLKEEEESRLAALREEQLRQNQTVNQELERIREQLSSLTQSILTVEQQLQRNSTAFLNSHIQLQSKPQAPLPHPQLLSGVLIDEAKVLGNLGFRVWEKMKGLVHCSPVILDPNTANSWTHVSEDMSRVRRGDAEQQLPLNPERFTNYTNVLGSEGFSSGRHQWDVEVGDHPDWSIGVAKESIDRKGMAIPRYAIWCLNNRSGVYSDGDGRTLKLKKSPQKIRVHLDYGKGKVSFFDTDNMSLVHSYKDTFTEKIFPFFSVGKAGDAKSKDIHICQTEVHKK